MSYFDRINESTKHKVTCEHCNKDFTWSEEGPYYPGGNSREPINCPYCEKEHSSIRTNGFVFTDKIN